ncbi:ParA family protein, partial [Klebsiella pneumoniae]
MPLICVCSPKGGVGKTTLAANLPFFCQTINFEKKIFAQCAANAT